MAPGPVLSAPPGRRTNPTPEAPTRRAIDSYKPTPLGRSRRESLRRPPEVPAREGLPARLAKNTYRIAYLARWVRPSQAEMIFRWTDFRSCPSPGKQSQRLPCRTDRLCMRRFPRAREQESPKPAACPHQSTVSTQRCQPIAPQEQGARPHERGVNEGPRPKRLGAVAWGGGCVWYRRVLR